MIKEKNCKISIDCLNFLIVFISNCYLNLYIIQKKINLLQLINALFSLSKLNTLNKMNLFILYIN